MNKILVINGPDSSWELSVAGMILGYVSKEYCPTREAAVEYWERVRMLDGVQTDELTAEDRKERPICTGVLDYFPKALNEVAHCSFTGNSQHHPDKPLHWDKSKSTDEADALVRHLLQRGTYDSDGVRHSAKVVWRALAMLERELDGED